MIKYLIDRREDIEWSGDMTFTIDWGWWILPVLFTILCLFPFCRLFFAKDDSYGISQVFALLFLIPILLVWVVYLLFR